MNARTPFRLDVAIADDHVIFRRGLRHIIEGQRDMCVVGEASTAAELLQLLQRTPAHVVVLDISMPERSGLDILPEIKRQYPRTPVLILSMHPEDQFAVRALRAGAAGYLTLETVPEDLVEAIRLACQGRRYVCRALAERLVTALTEESGGAPHESLSNREFQVLCLIAGGRTPTEIAQLTDLSVKTVSTYRARILSKMGMHTNADLIRYARQAGRPVGE
jgi:DNA-binding NarL/FixJ family response regulator